MLAMERARFHDLLHAEAALAVKLLWCFAQVLSLRLDDVTAHLSDDLPSPREADERLRRPPLAAKSR